MALLGLFVFALVCYLVAEVLTEIVDTLVRVWADRLRRKRP